MGDSTDNDYTPEDRINDDEWTHRRLCVDGNCIGVIGPDGRCKECGRPGGDNPAGAGESLRTPAAADDDLAEDAPAPAASADAQAEDDADDWENRRLCPDGNCIGVIGPDGRCKECGRPAE